MTPKNFLTILCVFAGGQMVFQLVTGILESLFNVFGLSILESLNTVSTDTPSMYLYAGILAPITEELLFRGLILRTMEPFGKKFAIFTSAFLFGMFHGNLPQAPFAFAVGLVLGYTAMEYSIGWSMALHMFQQPDSVGSADPADVAAAGDVRQCNSGLGDSAAVCGRACHPAEAAAGNRRLFPPAP